jgi:hypothetical protein
VFSAWFFIRLFGQYVLSALLIFAARSEASMLLIQKHGLLPESIGTEGLEYYRFVFLGIGVLLSGIVLPIQLEIEKKKHTKLKRNLSKILAHHKNLFVEKLKKDLQQNNLHLHIRVFEPPRGFNAWWKKKLAGELFFEVKNYEGFSEVGTTKGLKFKVLPEGTEQGLVGKTFKDKEVYFDFNLKANQNDAEYKLDVFQKSCTNAYEFAITAPIFNPKNEVIAVVSLDSEEKINKPDEQNNEWKQSIKMYCFFIHSYIPFLTEK